MNSFRFQVFFFSKLGIRVSTKVKLSQHYMLSFGEGQEFNVSQ